MPSSDNTASAAAGDHHEEPPSLLDTDEELATLDPTARRAMLQGMAERSARAARGEVFGPPVPVPLHGPQPGTPRASGAIGLSEKRQHAKGPCRTVIRDKEWYSEDPA